MEISEMYCPFMCGGDYKKCIGTQCMLWRGDDSDKGNCAIMQICDNLNLLSADVDEINERNRND
jgi:hypothetical protein